MKTEKQTISWMQMAFTTDENFWKVTSQDEYDKMSTHNKTWAIKNIEEELEQISDSERQTVYIAYRFDGSKLAKCLAKSVNVGYSVPSTFIN